ncbi:hypothetical protein BD769DRAFT_1451748 [Suillus cothurnatus]|nr:hypothetical protein BD769DRAFT_1451748 [Suillus cothurnatus]
MAVIACGVSISWILPLPLLRPVTKPCKNFCYSCFENRLVAVVHPTINGPKISAKGDYSNTYQGNLSSNNT